MVQQYKVDKVKEVAGLIDKYPIVGIIDMNKLPASQLHSIKKDIRGVAKVLVVKKRLIKLALDKSSKKEAKNLLEKDVAIPALIFSDENPFKLFATLKKNKAEAFAKAGDKAPKEIIVPEGETDLPPGPIIGALQKVNVKARIQGNNIVVTEDSPVASEGEEISPELSSILMQLGIKPMEIGLNLVAVCEDGTIFDKNVLDIDVDEYAGKISSAYLGAFNLAMNAGVPNKETIPHLIGKAHMEGLNLAVNADVVNSKTIEIFISKAQAHMSSVASRLPEDARGGVAVAEAKPAQEKASEPAEEKKEEKKEDKKPEDSAAGLGALFG